MHRDSAHPRSCAKPTEFTQHERAFAHFINDPRFFGVPMILETPKGKDARVDFERTNLKKLRTMIHMAGLSRSGEMRRG